MLTKNELKYYSSLLKKKHRQTENKFIAEGKKIVEEAFASDLNCELVCVTNQFVESNKEFNSTIVQTGVRLEIIKNHELEKLSDAKSPQGICAVFEKAASRLPDNFNNKLVVALDNINDPGNLGTIIRTCDWFGVNELILSSNTADLYSPKVIRSTMGSLFHIETIMHADLVDELNRYRMNGYQILLADLDGESINHFKPTNKTVVILSNEANGPGKGISELADKRVTIPRTGKAESLNVAIAAGIIINRLTS